ncbi:MAG: metallophosphoesterase [Chitinophagaceae bacterium]
MSLSRRDFLGLSVKSIVVIGAGNILQSFAPGEFFLPSPEKVSLRFALASDGHYGEPNTKFELHYDEMIGWLNREKKQRGVDFSMINGDLIHNDPAFLPTVKIKLDQLDMPYYVSHGNHDMVDGATWEETWKIPLHYAFEKKNSAFLILDTADKAGKYICPDIEWTRKQLIRYSSKKQLFVFMHITPVDWTKNAIVCPELVALFSKQVNLKAVFHGHDHDQDSAKERDGKHYFFDSHIAGSWGTAYRGYRMVEVLTDGQVLTYQVNPTSAEKVNNHRV